MTRSMALVLDFLKDQLTTENALCVLGIAAFSSVSVYAINVASKKGEDTEKIKVLEREKEELFSKLGVKWVTDKKKEMQPGAAPAELNEKEKKEARVQAEFLKAEAISDKEVKDETGDVGK